MYRHLDIASIVSTLERLSNRICERFPEASLYRVSQELLTVARESEARVRRLRRPRWLLRIAVVLVIVLFVAAIATLVATATSIRFQLKLDGDVSDLVQTLDAAANEVILLAIAIFFLMSLEGRIKRREALGALHQLRSIAHVIDMHQLTKDPEAVLAETRPTPSSPQRTMTRFELSRYLDYCSELLAMIGKLAALHVQHLPDPVVLNAVNDVETLAGDLSQKVWQKIMILDAARDKSARSHSQPESDSFAAQERKAAVQEEKSSDVTGE